MARPYEALRVLVDGSVAAVQPSGAEADGGGGAVPTLSVDLATGRAALSAAPALGAAAEDGLAVIGVFQLRGGSVLALVTGAERVATLLGQPVFRVTATRLVTPAVAAFDAGEQRLLAYLQDALSPRGAGRNLCFSYGAELTLSAQALGDALAAPGGAQQSPARRADARFFWNRVLSRPLLDARADAFVLPMIVGSVGQLEDVRVSAHGRSATLSVALIARRALDRAGTRHWRRGLDRDGNAANFVETEQLVTLRHDGDEGATAPAALASYVQVRGSVPLLWAQTPNIKYKPPTVLLEGGPSSAAFDAHMGRLVASYARVSAVNLVNQHGSEGRLEAAFAAEARRYARAVSAALSYHAFDFHHECGATSYGPGLAALWKRLKPEFDAFGQLTRGVPGAPDARQQGVFRTNCVDCLDRTNVVQGLLGRHALERVLAALGVLQGGEALGAALPAFEARFKGLWADHGDDISRQYAGTGALKSGFTRTGKRTLAGLLDDGAKSAARYYLNNFKDGRKQDALDLVSGAYGVRRDVALRFARRRSPALPVAAALLALGYALAGISAAARGALPGQQQRSGGGKAGGVLGRNAGAGDDGATAGDSDPSASFTAAVGQRIVAPLLLAGGLLLMVVKHGRQLVDRPQLCPQLANTVAAAAAPSSVSASGGADTKEQ